MKNKLNKKGFTLVELLAVIVVLAVIMVIAFTSVSSTITSARKNSFKSSIQMLQREVKNRAVAASIAEEKADIVCSSYDECASKYDISKNDYNMIVYYDGTSYYVSIEGIGKFKDVKLPDGSIDNAKTYGNSKSKFSYNTATNSLDSTEDTTDAKNVLHTFINEANCTPTTCNLQTVYKGKALKITSITNDKISGTYDSTPIILDK